MICWRKQNGVAWLTSIRSGLAWDTFSLFDFPFDSASFFPNFPLLFLHFSLHCVCVLLPHSQFHFHLSNQMKRIVSSNSQEFKQFSDIWLYCITLGFSNAEKGTVGIITASPVIVVCLLIVPVECDSVKMPWKQMASPFNVSCSNACISTCKCILQP